MPSANNRKKVDNMLPLKRILCGALILFFALMPGTSFGQMLQTPKIKTVVIDAGHGGGDTGSMSKDKKYKEKNITLAVALKLGAMMNVAYPSINVIFTRNSDYFIPLGERPAIANRNKADLFISIHVNSEVGTSGRGTETYVMGNHVSGNFDLIKRENSVITMENDYSTKYAGFNPNSPESYIIFSLLQNSHLEQSVKLAQCIQEEYKNGPVLINRGVKPGALYVLWKAAMPAILTEIGFISNNNDLEILVSEDGQRKIAADILRAFSKYKTLYEGGKLENLPPDAFAGGDAIYGDNNSQKEETKTASNRKEEVNPSKNKEVTTEDEAVEKDETTKKDETAKKDDSVRQNNSTLLYPSDTEKTSSSAKRNGASAITTSRNENNSAKGSFYCIQILSVNKQLGSSSPDLKGRKDADYLHIGNLYKYYIGKWNSRQEATKHLKDVQRTFKGAFVIKVSDGHISN
jgi:N-acetylmuramoyl-L-alanine amidase